MYIIYILINDVYASNGAATQLFYDAFSLKFSFNSPPLACVYNTSHFESVLQLNCSEADTVAMLSKWCQQSS